MMEGIQAEISGLPERVFKAGETVIAEDKPAEGLFFLVSGTVEVSKQGMRITRVKEPGAVFGEMSVILGRAPTATVVAVNECVFKLATGSLELLKANPQVAFYVSTVLAQRLNALNRYLVDLKTQFQDRSDHLGFVDEILDAIMNSHPVESAGDERRRASFDED
ncbi:MAG: Crp/Fnr family transcriptional regulator [Opitutales bacterium]